jgi:hypothetical protein
MIAKIRPVLFVSLFLLGGGVPAQAQVPTGQGPLTYPVPPATSTTTPRQQRMRTNPSPDPFGTRRTTR